MATTAPCPVCASGAKIDGLPSADRLVWECARCGRFELTGSAQDGLQRIARRVPGAISGWIRRQNSQGLTPSIGTNDLRHLSALTLPSLKERMELYLQAAVKKCPRLNDEFNATSEDLIGVSYSVDRAEASIIAKYLANEELLLQRPGGEWRVSPKGRIAADELVAHRAASTQAFTAMWFSNEMMLTYREAIEPAIQSAGYTSMMIGDKEHANKIDDEIISEIRRSAFLVADFTGHRGGVYFEAGFAMGLGLPVIWTCRKDGIEGLHFDIRQYNCIDWSSHDELRDRLHKRITAVLGEGPVPH